MQQNKVEHVKGAEATQNKLLTRYKDQPSNIHCEAGYCCNHEKPPQEISPEVMAPLL